MGATELYPPRPGGRKVGMTIIGIGTDIVECLRIRRMIDRHGELFLTRVYTDRELRYCQRSKHATEHFAGRWAAKEAVLKCLGTGWSKGLCWTDIEVCNDTSGKPAIHLHAATRDYARSLGIGDILISLSHCRAYATAYALALGTKPPSGGAPG
jgi:holo-[acyl-carrier protein] synthase